MLLLQRGQGFVGALTAADRTRSALGCVLDRWQRKVDNASGILNDPNDWCDEHGDPKYVVTLIGRSPRSLWRR